MKDELFDHEITWRSYKSFYSTSKLIAFLAITGLIIMGLATNFRGVYNFNMF